MIAGKNLVVSEMVRAFQLNSEGYNEAVIRVAADPRLLTRIYNQVYTNFSSEKSLRKYILNKL